MIKFLNWKILLFLIIFLAIILRLWQLGDVPSGFHADEAAFGYNAYSILETGKDEYGQKLPIVLKSFGDFKGAAFAYFTIPSIAIFNLTPFAARFPSVVFSIGSIIFLFFLIKDITKNRNIALISAFLLTISPWDINITRVTGDVVSGVFFCLLLVFFLNKLLHEKNILFFIFSILSGVIAILCYAPFRFFVIILAIIFLGFSIKKNKKKIIFNKIILLTIIIFLLLGIIYSLIGSIERFNQLSIFSHPQTKLVLEEQIREDSQTSVFITRTFHNKLVNYSRTILSNAQQYFTLDFLALKGGFPLRERIPGVGLFYLWEIPFLLAGIYLIVKNKNRIGLLFLSWWILLLLPTFITFDEIPNVHRTLIVLPAICVIIAYGINSFLHSKFRKTRLYKVIFLLLVFLAIYEFMYFIHQYFVHANVHQPWYRGYAYKGLVEKINKYYPDYKKIVITKGVGSPYIYILFYNKYDPEKYQLQGSPRDLDYSGFDKYYFVPIDCPLTEEKTALNSLTPEENVLYVEMDKCKSELEGARLIDEVFWADGSRAFKIVDYKVENND